jgi:F-type H+-transporting ATPase subunit a
LAWQHSSHSNEGWPLHAYLDKLVTDVRAKAGVWAKKNAPGTSDPYKAYLSAHPDLPQPWIHELLADPQNLAKWQSLKSQMASSSLVKDYKEHAEQTPWSAEKLKSYNESLDGKILIPQPFGTPRNAYEAESGFCISRYMVIEVVVAFLLFYAFRWLAKRMKSGDAPKGKAWNVLEGMVQAVRSNVVVPAMGEHDADRFMPFLWTMFFFILGCNLMGMIPWVGSPTASLGTTAALAGLVFAIGVFFGVKAFGIVGYLKNICPELGLPWYIAFWVVPLLWIIEFASLFIKHAVLAVRLLMNMGAGHLVLLGILGIGVSLQTAMALSTPAWMGVAGLSVLGTTVLSFLELFVAFLQAYVFTFLAALFIGSAIHHH